MLYTFFTDQLEPRGAATTAAIDATSPALRSKLGITSELPTNRPESSFETSQPRRATPLGSNR